MTGENLTLDELDEAIAGFMEPRPADVSARELRSRVKDWQWHSSHDYDSPNGWWTAEIGTDHGPPEDDDKPVCWRPKREPQYDIGDAWRVVGRLNELGWQVVVKQMPEGIPYVIDPENTKIHQRAVVSLQWVQWLKDASAETFKIGPTVVADTPEEAICRAALRAAGGA